MENNGRLLAIKHLKQKFFLPDLEMRGD